MAVLRKQLTLIRSVELTHYNMFLDNKRNGGSLVEFIVALGIFMIVGTGIILLVLGALQGNTNNTKRIEALFIVEEGVDAVKSVRDHNWGDLVNGEHGLTVTNGYWEFSGTSEAVGSYTRIITISDVERDLAGDIIDVGGVVDPRTKKATVLVTWLDSLLTLRSQMVSFYLHDWNVYDWTETTSTDFAGGVLSNVLVSGLGEAGKLNLALGQGLLARGGSFAVEDTDADFSVGTFTNTVVEGSGLATTIRLGTSAGWGVATWPDTKDIYDIEMLSPTSGWAVGESGKIFNYDGVNWTQFVDLGGSDIQSIDMVSASDGWAVGNSGKIYRYNGTTWSQFVDVGSTVFYALDMVSASDGWAVGNSGKIYRYNGTTWSQFVDTGSHTFYALDMVSASDGWALGSSSLIYHYNGVSWSEFDDLGGNTFYGVDMVSANDGWAVGSSGKFYHYDGASWTEVIDLSSNNIAAVDMVSASEGWAVGGNGRIFVCDGVAWVEQADVGQGNEKLNTVYMLDSADGWIGGNGGTALHFGDNYVAAGTFESGVIDSGLVGSVWNAITWVEVLPPNTDITVNVRSGATAVPDGSWSAWSGNLITAAGELLTVANNQYLQYRVNLSTTDTQMTPEFDSVSILYNAVTSGDLFGVSMISASDGWAVGESGKIYHYDGSSWSEFDDMGNNDLFSINMISASDGWAVGESGGVYYYDGVNWSEFADLGVFNLNTINMLTGSGGWIVGDNGNLYEFAGGYASPGVYTSIVLDTDSAVNRDWQQVYWTETTPVGTAVSVALRSGNVAVPDGSWSAWSSELTNAAGNVITVVDARYLQYRVTLTTTDGAVTPTLEAITITYK